MNLTAFVQGKSKRLKQVMLGLSLLTRIKVPALGIECWSGKNFVHVATFKRVTNVRIFWLTYGILLLGTGKIVINSRFASPSCAVQYSTRTAVVFA